jgi:hypothetical protein
MKPTREYRKAIDEPVFSTPGRDDIAFAAREYPATGLVDKDEDEAAPESVYTKITPGYWSVAEPERGYYPEDEYGERSLFRAHPTEVKSLYSTKDVTPHAVQHVLALAHEEAKKHGPGTLTYSTELSRYSSPMVLNALKKGYVVENPHLRLEDLEAHAEDRDHMRRMISEMPADQRASFQSRINWERRSSGNVSNDVTERIFSEHEDNGDEDFMDYHAWHNVEELPSTAGEEATNSVLDAKARRFAKLEQPEPKPAPLPDEGNLWDHANRKDKASWESAPSQPKASRLAAFREKLGGLYK